MIRKVLFPVAGRGTRMLPFTKEIPKEILPVIDKPLIHYAVEEAVQSGLNELIMVTSRGKEALENYFSPNPELDLFLKEKGKEHLLGNLSDLYDAHFVYIRQNFAKGFGDAVMLGETAIGSEPFAIILPDDLMIAQPPVLAQMIGVYERYQAPMIAFIRVPPSEVPRYGIASGPFIEENLFEIEELVEKPLLGQAPSNFAVMGRYIMPPEIFPILRRIQAGAGGEIQLTDAVRELMKTQKVLGFFFQGERFDAGTPCGYIETVLSLALKRDDTRTFTRELLRSLTLHEDV